MSGKTTSIRRLATALRSDTRGATMVEFALAAPILILLLCAAFDFGYAIYARAVLQGAVQNAGRDAGLESGASNLDTIDGFVIAQVKNLVPQGTVLTSRKNYKTFNDVSKPEDFVDANSNGEYDDTECFTDVNDNGNWDEDRGEDGQGGADDVVLYTAVLSYDRIIPFWRILGGSPKAEIAASTTLRNQPFGDQGQRMEVQICPSPA